MMKFGLFLFSLVFATISYAGPIKTDTDGIEVGNGGFIVQCPLDENANGFKEITNFYDYYEYVQLHPEWRIDPSFGDPDYYKTSLNIIGNYLRIDKFSAEPMFANAAMWFGLEQTQTVMSLLLPGYDGDNQDLVPAPQPYTGTKLPENCRTTQIISFVKEQDGSFKYSIDPGEFSLLDPVNKAVALIHEITYLEQIQAIEKAPIYPSVIRQTQFIFSLPNLRNADRETILYWQTQNSYRRQQNRLEFAQYGKYKIRLRKPADEIPQKISSQFDYTNTYWNPLYTLEIKKNRLIASAYLDTIIIKDKQTDLNIWIGGDSEFHDNGELKKSRLQGPLFYLGKMCWSHAEFNENGDFKGCK